VKFKVDENLPAEAAELLGQAGHEAATIHDEHLSGRADPHIESVCQNKGLITLDVGFADIRTYPPYQSPGIVVRCE